MDRRHALRAPRTLPSLWALIVALLVGAPPAFAEAPAHKAHARLPALGAPAAPPATASGVPGRRHKILRGLVNLNTADETTLELMPGIGEAMAERIVTWRKTHPFRRVEDFTRVKGIGRKKLARLRPLLAVSGPSTLVEEDANAEPGRARSVEEAPARSATGAVRGPAVEGAERAEPADPQ